MYKYIFLSFFLFFSSEFGFAKNILFPQVFDEQIKTVHLNVNNQNLLSESTPVLELNSEDILFISFDELSYEQKTFYCRLVYCNKDWEALQINEYEFLDGINLFEIEDAEQSINTTTLYTHYQFELPNEYVRFKVSGNYIIQVFEDIIEEKIAFQFRCKIVENLADIKAQVGPNTYLGYTKKHQQIDFDVNLKELDVHNPLNDIYIKITQNQRIDNEKSISSPSFINNKILTYKNHKDCVFEAGNEYRSLDISNIYILDEIVSEIKFKNDKYLVELYPSKSRNKIYLHSLDVNGRYTINLQKNTYEDELEADYTNVLFKLDTKQMFFDGNIYLMGGFNFQHLQEKFKMKYDFQSDYYYLDIMLKQGGYNFLYTFLPSFSSSSSLDRIEGDFWESENEYEIFVYYKPPYSQVERIIAYKKIYSNK